MTDEEVVARIRRARQQGAEDAQVEFKAAVAKVPRSVWESVSAFANTSGGLVVLGLQDGAGFTPAVGFDAGKIEDGLRASLDTAAKAVPKVSPIPDYTIGRTEVDGAPVVWLQIEPLAPGSGRDAPCYVVSQGVERGSYKRVGEADQHLSTYEVHLLHVRSRSRADYTDRTPVRGRTLNDLDPHLVAETLSRVRASGSRALDGLSSNDTATALQRLNVLTQDGTPTLAGYLALGAYPQADFPQLTIDVAVHPGTAKSQDPTVRFLDRRNCDGPLPKAIDDAVNAVTRNLRTTRVVEGAQAHDVPEIPDDVLREAIANAVMHRDYSDFVSGQQVAVDVYADRVEVINPGGFWGDRTKENITEGRSSSRNGDLVRLLTVVPMPDQRSVVCENQGSGVPRMLAQMRAHGLPAPDYSASKIDSVVLRLDRFGLLDLNTLQWLAALRGYDSLSREQQAALALVRRNGGVSVLTLRNNLGLDSDDCRAILAELVSEGLLVGMNDGPYVLADQSKTLVATGAEWTILDALDAEHPTSIRELAEATSKRPTALRPTLKGLVERGLVIATAPPSSKNRRYLLARD